MSKKDPKYCETRLQAAARLEQCLLSNGKCVEDGYDRNEHLQFSRSTAPILRGLALWFREADWIPDKDRGHVWSYDLDSYVVEAFSDFRTLDRWADFRKEFVRESSYCFESIPDLEDPRGSSDWLHVTHELSYKLPLIIDQFHERENWLEHKLLSRFNARGEVLNQSWKRFVRKCLRPMAPQLKEDSFRSRTGKFGGVKVTTYAMAGRVQFGFERGDDDMVYVHDESDMTGLRSGPNFSRTCPLAAARMIDDVIADWDFSKFKENKRA